MIFSSITLFESTGRRGAGFNVYVIELTMDCAGILVVNVIQRNGEPSQVTDGTCIVRC